MSYEDQLIREATGEYRDTPFNPFGEEDAEETDESNGTDDIGGNVVPDRVASNEDQYGGNLPDSFEDWLKRSGDSI